EAPDRSLGGRRHTTSQRRSTAPAFRSRLENSAQCLVHSCRRPKFCRHIRLEQNDVGTRSETLGVFAANAARKIIFCTRFAHDASAACSLAILLHKLSVPDG